MLHTSKVSQQHVVQPEKAVPATEAAAAATAMLTSKRSVECGWYSRSNIFFLNLKFNPKKKLKKCGSKIKQRMQKKKANSKSWARENRWRNWVNQKRLVTAASCDISISHKLALYEHSSTCFAPMMPKPDEQNEHHESCVCRAKNASLTTSKQTKYFRTKTNTSATELQPADRYFSQFLADENHPDKTFWPTIFFFSLCVFFQFLSFFFLFISHSLSVAHSIFFQIHQSIIFKQSIGSYTHTYIKGAHGCGSKEVN